MRFIIALALLIGGVASARAQSMTDMGWVVCSTFGGQYCRGAWAGSRNASTESMTKTKPVARFVRGPYYVSKAELAWHCYSTRALGCAPRSRDQRTCWIFVDETQSAAKRAEIVAHERRHCAGYTH
jgi:hypothetical protein